MGAAIFAKSQWWEDEDEVDTTLPGQFRVELNYPPITKDTEVPVAGVVSTGEGVEKDFTGFTIEFINSNKRLPWHSGKIGLGPKGNFMATVHVEERNANTIQIELCDPTGRIA